MENVIYSEILNGVDKSWSFIKKAKYVYNQICKLSRYDERAVYSKNKSLINSMYYSDINVDEPMEPVLVCRSLNLVYSKLLKRLGISCRCIEKPSYLQDGYNDVALIFYDESGNCFFTNIAADIQWCKYGMKTQFFGTFNKNYPDLNSDAAVVKVLSEQELREIDEDIGYVKRDGDYSDIVFRLISSEVKQNVEFKKLLVTTPDIVRQYLSKQGVRDVPDGELQEYISRFDADDIIQIKMMVVNLIKHHDFSFGYIENKSQSKSIFNSIFDKTEKKLYDSFDMVKESANGIEVLSIIRIKIKSEYLYYKYSQETHEYELMSIEEALLIARDYKSYSKESLIGDDSSLRWNSIGLN